MSEQSDEPIKNWTWKKKQRITSTLWTNKCGYFSSCGALMIGGWSWEKHPARSVSEQREAYKIKEMCEGERFRGLMQAGEESLTQTNRFNNGRKSHYVRRMWDACQEALFWKFAARRVVRPGCCLWKRAARFEPARSFPQTAVRPLRSAFMNLRSLAWDLVSLKSPLAELDFTFGWLILV